MRIQGLVQFDDNFGMIDILNGEVCERLEGDVDPIVMNRASLEVIGLQDQDRIEITDEEQTDIYFDASGYDAWVLGGAGRKYIKKVENGSGLFTQ